MKKVKILLIIVIAIVGAYLIYNKFKDRNLKDVQIDKFLNEYTLIDENHSFEIINIDEAINILNNKTGIILFCNSGSMWCQYYVKELDDISISDNIEKIYYLDIKEERSMNTSKYKKIVSILNDYLPNDDTGNKRINMPTLTFVKDGKIIGVDSTTSIVSTDTTVEEYWNSINIEEFRNKITIYNELLNTNIIEESTNEIVEENVEK